MRRGRGAHWEILAIVGALQSLDFIPNAPKSFWIFYASNLSAVWRHGESQPKEHHARLFGLRKGLDVFVLSCPLM